MTPKQRFLAALRLETPDRVPLMYQHLGGAKWVLASCGKSMREGFHDPDTFAEIALTSHKLFGFDNVMAGWGDLLVEAHALGTQWKWPERDFYPRVDTYAVQSPTDVDKIQPVDPIRDDHWSVLIRAAGIMQGKIGKEVEVVGYLNSPFLVASEMMGYENLLMTLFKGPEAVDKLLSIIVESEKMYVDRVTADVALDSIFLENGSAGAETNSPELCERYDLRYAKMILDRSKAQGMRSILHNCAAEPYLEAQAQLGADALHFNNKAVQLGRTFESLRGKLCVISGIDHMELLFKRSPDEVEEEVKKIIRFFGKSPGIILAPGCEMPFKTPLENIRRLKEATERFGTY